MTKSNALLGLAGGLLGAVAAGVIGWLGAPALAAWRAPPDAPTAAAAGLRKCTLGGRLLYTNGDCPAGSQQSALKGGAVTVLELPRNPAPAASSASGVPNVRQLLIDPKAIDIQDKRMEAIIGQ